MWFEYIAYVMSCAIVTGHGPMLCYIYVTEYTVYNHM